MNEIPTASAYTLNELYTKEEVLLYFSDKELADIIKGFEMPLATIKEEAPKIEKPQIGELADIVNGFEIPLATIKEEAPKIENHKLDYQLFFIVIIVTIFVINVTYKMIALYNMSIYNW